MAVSPQNRQDNQLHIPNFTFFRGGSFTSHRQWGKFRSMTTYGIHVCAKFQLDRCILWPTRNEKLLKKTQIWPNVEFWGLLHPSTPSPIRAKFDMLEWRHCSGVLLFVENPMSAEKLLLQLVDSSSVLFEFSDATTTRSVRGVPLHPGIWYRVIASRYMYVGRPVRPVCSLLSSLLRLPRVSTNNCFHRN